MSRQADPSNLTDAQWAILEPLIPPPAPDAPHLTYERREIVNAILYVLRSGCPWRMLPHDLPAWGTVSWYFRRWQREGGWERILHALRKQVRIQHGRDPEPSATIIDSQSLKTSAVRGPEKGYDSGKKIWGRKRHILIDTQGNRLAVKVTAASRSDQQGGKCVLEPLVGKFPRIKLVWGDSHYAGEMILWLLQHLGWLTETIRRSAASSSDQETSDLATTKKEHSSSSGFHPLPRRWVVERSLAWITRWRRLCRDHEGLPASSEASSCSLHLDACFPCWLLLFRKVSKPNTF